MLRSDPGIKPLYEFLDQDTGQTAEPAFATVVQRQSEFRQRLADSRILPVVFLRAGQPDLLAIALQQMDDILRIHAEFDRQIIQIPSHCNVQIEDRSMILHVPAGQPAQIIQ